jgi:hypothetical protein
VEIIFTPHGPVVNITGSLVKAAIMAAGVWIGSHTDATLADHIVGGLITAGAGWGLWDHLTGSNDATERLFGKAKTS